jgi:hypothetical protein
VKKRSQPRGLQQLPISSRASSRFVTRPSKSAFAETPPFVVGILDAVQVRLVPYLIGKGIPYFAGLERTPVRLGQPKVVEGKGVTHLHYELER